jgi:hypothetical protein
MFVYLIPDGMKPCQKPMMRKIITKSLEDKNKEFHFRGHDVKRIEDMGFTIS